MRGEGCTADTYSGAREKGPALPQQDQDHWKGLFMAETVKQWKYRLLLSTPTRNEIIRTEFKYISQIKGTVSWLGFVWGFFIALLKLNSNRTWEYFKETVIYLY